MTALTLGRIVFGPDGGFVNGHPVGGPASYNLPSGWLFRNGVPSAIRPVCRWSWQLGRWVLVRDRGG